MKPIGLFSKIVFCSMLLLCVYAVSAAAQTTPAPWLEANANRPVTVGEPFWIMIWDSDGARNRYEWDFSMAEGISVLDGSSYPFRIELVFNNYTTLTTVRCRRISPGYSPWSTVVINLVNRGPGGGSDTGRPEEIPGFPGD